MKDKLKQFTGINFKEEKLKGKYKKFEAKVDDQPSDEVLSKLNAVAYECQAILRLDHTDGTKIIFITED